MFSALRRLLVFFPGEGHLVCLLSLLGFTWAFGASLATKLADILFYLHVKAEHIPQSVSLQAIFSFVFVCILFNAYTCYRPCQIFLYAIGFEVLVSLLSFLGLTTPLITNQPFFFFILKALFNCTLFILITTYWNFVDQYLNLNHATRIYGLLNAAIFLGFSIAGAGIASSLVNIKSLFLLSSIALIATMTLIFYIRSSIPLENSTNRPKKEATKNQVSLKASAKNLIYLIFSSPFARIFLITNILIQTLSTTAEYTYILSFENYFRSVDSFVMTGNEAEAALTVFLGQCMAWVSLGNIFFSLFFYGRSIQHFGIQNIIFLTPFSFLLFFSSSLLNIPSLIIPFFGFIIVEGILYIFDDNNFSLLLKKFDPSSRYHMRVASESLFEPIGLLLGSLLLQSNLFNPSLINLLFTLLTLISSYYLRSYIHKPKEVPNKKETLAA